LNDRGGVSNFARALTMLRRFSGRSVTTSAFAEGWMDIVPSVLSSGLIIAAALSGLL